MRRRRAEKRFTIPDPKFSSEMVARFVSIVMTKGKKTIAESIVYGALDLMKDKTPEETPLKAFNKAIDNVRPRLEVKGRRVGGANPDESQSRNSEEPSSLTNGKESVPSMNAIAMAC